MYLPTAVSLCSHSSLGGADHVDRPIKVDPTGQLHTLKIRTFTCIMPFQLWHGDYVDDTDPWCPVCFNLSYENLKFGWSQQGGRKENKASPCPRQKGLLCGFHVWWRARYDFQNRAEQYDCVFCAILLQIVDRFWRRPKPGKSSRPTLCFELMVLENGSVELEDFDGFNNRPTRLILFTPSGIASPRIFREYKLTTSCRRAVDEP